MRKKTATIALWIACLAVLMAALAPSISHALNRSRGGTQAMAFEICTAAGMISMAAPADTPSLPGKHAMAMDDCPFCSMHFDQLGLPPTAFPLVAADSRASAAPRLFYQSPRPLFAWAPPQSRAPPAMS